MFSLGARSLGTSVGTAIQVLLATGEFYFHFSKPVEKEGERRTILSLLLY